MKMSFQRILYCQISVLVITIGLSIVIAQSEDTTEIPNTVVTKAECMDLASKDDLKCCFQWTWYGHVFNPHIPSPRVPQNCSQVHALNPGAVCQGPLAYSSNSTRRPDPAKVSDFCDDHARDCYCAATTCISYIIYENTKEERRITEMHGCGRVLMANDKSQVMDGCYKESKNGTIHEVCVCSDESFCNGSSWEFAVSWIILITLTFTRMLIWYE